MPTLSDSILAVTLPSGNRAVYLLQPQQVNLSHYGATLAQVAIERGRQLAHELDGRWFAPGGWHEITDVKTVALLERVPDA